MADAESIREAVRARAPFSSWIGVVGLFFLFGVIVLAVVGPGPRGDTYEQERAKKRMDNLKAAHEADAKELASYGWIDKNKGAVRVPIARAMELTVADLSRQTPGPAYPIAAASPPPAGAAPPSPSASPAPQPTGTPKPTSITGPMSEAGAQPAAAVKPAGAEPGSQPGASATPAASPQSSAAQPAASPSPTATPSAAGSPLPVRGKETPSPSPQ